MLSIRGKMCLVKKISNRRRNSRKRKIWGRSWTGKSSNSGQISGQHTYVAHDSQCSQVLKFSQCYRCGRNHDVCMCPAREWECFSCNTKIHTSKMLRQKLKTI